MQVIIPNEIAFQELYDPSKSLFFRRRLIDSNMFPAPIWLSGEGIDHQDYTSTHLTHFLRFKYVQRPVESYFKRMFRAYTPFVSPLVGSSVEEVPILKTTPLKAEELRMLVQKIRREGEKYVLKGYPGKGGLCARLSNCLEGILGSMQQIPMTLETEKELYPRIFIAKRKAWYKTYGKVAEMEESRCVWPISEDRTDELGIAHGYLMGRLKPELRRLGHDALIRLSRERRLDELVKEMERKNVELIAVSIQTGLPILTRDAGIAKFAHRWNFNRTHENPELQVVFSVLDMTHSGFNVYYNSKEFEVPRVESYPNFARRFKC